MNNVLLQLDRLVHALSRWFNLVAGAAVVGMLGLVVTDIIGVKLFKAPIPGAIEIVGYLGIIVVAFAIAHTLVIRGHIQLEFFTMRLPPRIQAGVLAVVNLLNLALFAIIAWQSYEFAAVLRATGEVSMTQRIPFYPFVYAIALCCVMVCLVMLTDVIKQIRKAVQS